MDDVRFLVTVTMPDGTPLFSGFVGKDDTLTLERDGGLPARLALTATGNEARLLSLLDDGKGRS